MTCEVCGHEHDLIGECDLCGLEYCEDCDRTCSACSNQCCQDCFNDTEEICNNCDQY